jgi:NAD(P)H-nitrite reductase large subunit
MKLGVAVNVVEMKDRVLNTILDDEASLMTEQNLKRKGVGIITGHTVSEIMGESSMEGVILDNGERVPCELVVMAIGVLPRTELARNTGIKVNRGIVVDRHMATSCPDVYACGDVAEAYDFIYGINRITPIWPNAYIGGMVAGRNMAGIEADYAGGTAMNSLNYFGMDITTAGIVAPQDSSVYEVISRRREDGVYQKVILGDGLVKGMVFIGDIEKSGMIFGLMRGMVKVDGFKHELLADDFGLAYFPAELRRERLGVVPSKAATKS